MSDGIEQFFKNAQSLFGRREKKQLKKLKAALSNKVWMKKKKARKVQQLSRRQNWGLL